MDRFDASRAAELIKAARLDAGMSQSRLAESAGIAQSNLAAIESGRRIASGDMVERLLRAADYRPTVALRLNRGRLLAEAPNYKVTGIRVYGSIVRGEDHFDSDIDLLVDAEPADYLTALGFSQAVERATGFPVDIHVAKTAEASGLGREILDQAVPL
jgi:predicted nucleotidyltransferase